MALAGAPERPDKKRAIEGTRTPDPLDHNQVL